MDSRATFEPGILLRRPAAPSPADLKAAFLRVFHEDELQHKLQIRQQKRSIQRRQQRKRQKIESDKILGDRPKRKPKKKKRKEPLEEEAEEEESDGDPVSDLEKKLDGLVCCDIKKDSAIYAPIVRTCGKARDLRAGICVHDHIVKSGHGSDSFLGNLLVEIYGHCGVVEAARASFDQIPYKNVFSWNMMLAAYARNGHPREAMASFRRMLLAGARPDKITFLAALDACALMGALDQARGIHALVAELAADRDPAVANSLVSAYAKCRSPIEARAVFEGISIKADVISWNAAISACAIAEENDLASLFQRMDCEGIKPNKLTFLAAMAAARTEAAGEWLVRRVRHAVLEADVVVATGLIRLYGHLGRADDAREFFEGIARKDRDVVAWTAMVAAYARTGHARDAFEIFRRMELEGVSPNKITMLALMEACSCLGSLPIARAMYLRIDSEQQGLDLDVENGSIGMFGRCGSVEAARVIFDRMEHRRTLVSYTALISALAQNGCFDKADELFQSMLLHGFVPDKVSFTCFLFASIHTGLLHRGWGHFVSMSGDFGIRPSFEHYCCMVDLLARQGKLVDAEDLIANMPCKIQKFNNKEDV